MATSHADRPSRRRRVLTVPALLCSFMSAGFGSVASCRTVPPAQVAAPAAPIGDAQIESTVILIGDAGAADAGGDPVLAALAATVAEASGRTTVVFLGDNIYPNGLPRAGDAAWQESERRLLAQVDAARGAARVVFLPGNHDWTQTGQASDWDAVRRQGDRLAATGTAILRPQGGCPGPEIVDIGAGLRLVAIDTEWWLHGRPTPAADLRCAATTADEVTTQLDAALATAGVRHVIVAGHHPPVSAGPHGGHFDVIDHLFPLRAVKPWLWIPLPLVGSAYPLARQAGTTVQDQSHPVNRRMVATLRAVVAPHAPLLFAAGHEHQLGLFTGGSIGARYVAVSGAGIRGHKRGAVGRERDALFADRGPGFMRVDVLRDGRVRLTVVMPGDATAEPAQRIWWLS